MMNTPNNGPDVADVTNIEDSITPSSIPIRKATPMMMKANITLMTLMHTSCCESFISLMHGKGRTKSSKATVANEFRIDTFKLKIFVIYTLERNKSQILLLH